LVNASAIGQGTDIVQQFEQIQFSGGDNLFGTEDDQRFTITNTGNVKTLAADDAAAATQDIQISGHVLGNEVSLDQGQSAILVTNPGDKVSAYGTLHLFANGDYTFTANTSAAKALAQDQIVTQTFDNICVTDGANPESLTITITGTNDAPDITVGAGDSAAK